MKIYVFDKLFNLAMGLPKNATHGSNSTSVAAKCAFGCHQKDCFPNVAFNGLSVKIPLVQMLPEPHDSRRWWGRVRAAGAGAGVAAVPMLAASRLLLIYNLIAGQCGVAGVRAAAGGAAWLLNNSLNFSGFSKNNIRNEKVFEKCCLSPTFCQPFQHFWLVSVF